MGTKILLGLVLSLPLSCNVMAQSNTNSQSEAQVSRVTRGHDGSRGHVGRPARPSVQSVPELDGNMAFLALGLTFAVAALIREKRRTN